MLRPRVYVYAFALLACWTFGQHYGLDNGAPEVPSNIEHGRIEAFFCMDHTLQLCPRAAAAIRGDIDSDISRRHCHSGCMQSDSKLTRGSVIQGSGTKVAARLQASIHT